MATYADGLAGIASTADRAAAANALFGRSGMQLLPFLEQGAGALDQASEMAAKMGLNISRIDTKMIEQANDSMDDAKLVFASFGDSLAIKVAPMISAITSAFTDTESRRAARAPLQIRCFLQWQRVRAMLLTPSAA